MKSLHEWRAANSDPEWEQMKKWAGRSVDQNLVKTVGMKIEAIKENFARQMGDPKVNSWRDVPPNMRDGLAQAIVVATMKSFYPGGPEMASRQPKPAAASQPRPDQENNAPSGWKG